MQGLLKSSSKNLPADAKVISFFAVDLLLNDIALTGGECQKQKEEKPFSLNRSCLRHAVEMPS